MATNISKGAKHAVIYVKNLPWTVGHKELKNYFLSFGEIVKSNVMFDKQTGLSRGIGFVHFKERESLNQVFRKFDHSLEGKKLLIKNKQD